MATQVQFRRGTTADISTFIGADGEVVVDTTKKTCVVHDGVKIAGYPLLREDGSNSALNVGSLSSCALKFINDPNTGIISPGADQIALVTGGASRLSVDSSGSVTIPGNLLVAGAFTGTITLDNGSAAVPALRFTNDPDTGIYLAGTNEVAISTGGTQRLTTTTTEVTSTLPVLHPLGAAATPSLTFTGDTNTGVYSPGADQLAISTAATERARFDESGRLLVGTSSAIAAAPLLQIEQIAGAEIVLGRQDTSVVADDLIGSISFWGRDTSGVAYTEQGSVKCFADGTHDPGTNPTRLVFSTTADGAASPTERMRIDSAGQIEAGSLGTAAAPVWSFLADPNTGIYAPGADQVAISTGGTQRLTTTTTEVTSTLPVLHPLGAAATPSLTFTGDTNTGLYSPGADQVAISTNGTGRLFVDASGNVGVGSVSTSSFQSASSTVLSLRDTASSNIASLKVLGGAGAGAIAEYGATNGIGFCGTSGAHDFVFYTNSSERMRLDSSGRLGLGTSAPGAVLESKTANVQSGDAAYAKKAVITNIPYSTSNVTSSALAIYDGTIHAADIGYSYDGTGYYLTFGTNDNTIGAPIESLRIDRSGRVGVGTASPGTALDVNGVITSRSDSFAAVRFRSSTGTDKAFLSYEDGSTSVFLNNYGSGPIVFKTADAERVRIDSSGRVGIGTSSPQALLDITDTGNQPKLRLSTNTASNFLEISRSSSTGHYTFASEENGSSIIFATDPDGTGAQNRVTIDRYGKVGIGTSTPSFGVGDGLEVARSGVATVRVSSNTQGVELRSDAGTGTLETRGAFPLVLGTGGTERARIDSSGRLLVGTSSDISGGETNRVIQGAASTGAFIALSRTDATITNNEVLAGVEFRGNGNPSASIYAWADADHGTNDYPGRLVFSTTADGASSPTERMRIHNGGCVSVANGLVIGSLGAVTNSLNISGSVIASGAGNSTLKYNTSSGTVTYDTSSRLVKNQIVNCPYGISEIKKLQPRKYFRTDDQREEIGFIADEMVQVMPEFVPIGPKSVITKNEEDTEQIPIGVNYEKLTAVLTAALQETIAELEALKAEVAALKAQ